MLGLFVFDGLKRKWCRQWLWESEWIWIST